jgi:tetratricopeptide (TPR) repeat protein
LRLESGGEGRESNLNTSISLSMNSPRMTKDPDSLTLLAALSLLPDGFPLASIEELEECLGITGIRKLLRTLRAVALVRPEDSSPSPRIQMLSPILLFCHQFLSSKISLVVGPLTKYYIGMLKLVDDDETSNSQVYLHPKISPEIRNIHSIFQKAYVAGYQQDMGVLISCTAVLVDWSWNIGYVNRDTIQMALTRSATHPIPRARCLMSLGGLCRSQTHYREAERCYQEAAALFKEGNSTVFEARALHGVGYTLFNMRQLDKAEVVFNTCLTFYTKANNQKGQAHLRQVLGHVQMDKGQYAEAEANLTNALDAFKQMGDLLGIVQTAQILSNLYEIHGDLAISEKLAAEALVAAKETNNKYEEGRALWRMGRIYLRTNRRTDARQALEQALSIFKLLNNIAYHLAVTTDLGWVYIQSDQLSVAQALLTTSVKVDLETIQIPVVLCTLAHVYIYADRIDKAEPLFDQALLLYQKFGEKVGQADAFAYLGTVYFRSNRLDKAEKTLNLISNLGPRWHSEIHRLWALGDLYIAKGQLEEAERFLDEAMVQAKRWISPYRQGNILRSIGTLNIKRGHIDLAIAKFQEALELHRQVQWVYEQATDLKRLGEAYEMSGRSEDAAAAFKIYEQATDLKRLGEAYEMSGRSEDAAAAFKMADELMESVREARTLAL